MLTEKEMKEESKSLHDNLSEAYYKKHKLTKKEFDLQHGKIWADLEAKLITRGFLTLPEPARDLVKEIDNLKARLDALERKS